MQDNRPDSGKEQPIKRSPRHEGGAEPGRNAEGRQIDDNQDDLGRDVNKPDQVSNEINDDAKRPGRSGQA